MKSQVNKDGQPSPGNGDEQSKLNKDAFLEAENDIEQDPELKDEPEAGDDLDEGELARFEGEE